MSKTVDQRVVQMEFDNKNFEKNVNQSLSTLDKLKKFLSFGKETKSLEELQRQADRTKFNGMANAVEGLADKFRGLEMLGTVAFMRLANAAVTYGANIVKSLTIGPISEGYADYGRKLTSIQTITNATGKSIEEVNTYFRVLDTYADKTIYNLDDMTGSLAKFTNAGVDLNQSVPAIKGIANMVALAGQDANAAQIAMYNLSQSIAGGFLTTIDYKSLNLANVATKEWKENMAAGAIAAGTLKKNADGTFKVLGTKKDYNLQQLFSEGLSDQWATTNVMLDVLGKYGDETTDIGKKAQAAAQDVKSFGMMMDTLKASVGTGWTDTFEILIGNLEESKALFTPLSNSIGGFFDRMSDARNQMLQEWKDNGGRDDLIEGFKNLFGAIGAVIKPVKEAFREIFPPMTGKRLAELTEKFKEFTANLKISDSTAEKIKNTFKGFFSVIKTVTNVIVLVAKAAFNLLGVFKPLAGGVLTATSAFGKWLEKTTKVVRDSKIINKVLTTIVDTVKLVTQKLGEFFKETLKFDNIMNFFKTMFNFIAKIGLAIGKVFASIIRNGDLKNVMDIFNTGLVSVGLIGIIKMINNFGKAAKNFSGFMEGLKNVIGGVGDLLGAFTQQVQSKTLMNIAKAVTLLAISLLVLSLIPADKIAQSLGAMTATIAQLMIAFKILTKIAPDMKKSFSAMLSMIGIAAAVLILSTALKKLASLDLAGITRGLFGMAGAMAILLIGMKLMPTGKGMIRAAFGMIAMSTAMYIMAGALKKMGSLSLKEIGKSLLAMAGAMVIMTKAMNALPDKGMLSKSTGMLILAISLNVLGSAMKKLAELSWGDIFRSLTAMGGALLLMTVTMNKLPAKSMIGRSVGMVIMTMSLLILGSAMKKLAALSWEDIKKSLTAMGGALLLLVAATSIMAKTGAKTSGLLAASAALIMFAIGMKTLSKISWEGILKSFVALGVGILALVVAAHLLTPVAGTILLVAGAMALFGVGVAAFGAGLILIATGIGALGAALAVGATAIVAGVTAIILGILGMVPEIVKIIRTFLVLICQTVIEVAPLLAKALGTLLYEAIKMLADYIPPIVTVFLDLFIKVFRALADRMPELIVSMAEFIESLFRGFMQAFGIIDNKVLLEGIVALGILTTAFLMMATLASLAPAALIGVLVFGVLILELAAVLNTIGKIFEGKDLGSLYAAGDVLQAVGTAIGKFVGGLLGGFAAGMTSSLPKVADNLSEFMKNLKPFISGVSNINPNILLKVGALAGAILILSAANMINGLANLLSFGSSLPKMGKQLGEFASNLGPFVDMASIITPSMMQGVNALTGAIVLLTGANIIKGIGSFITGKNSFAQFGQEIADLGSGMKTFVKNLGTFSGSQVKTIEAACEGIKTLAQASKTIPNEGGVWGWLAGDNSIGKFSGYLPDLGTNLNKFITNLGTFSEGQVITVGAAANAIKTLAAAGKEIPNEGGVWGWLAGDNSIAKFADQLPDLGKHLQEFVISLGTFDEAQVKAAECAGQCILALAKAGQEVPNSGGLVSLFTGDNDISKFGEKLPSVALNLKQFAANLGSFSDAQIASIKAAGEAILALAKSAQEIPNSGGLVTLFTGDNDITKFGDKLPGVGTNLANFVKNLGTFTEAQVTTTDCAGRAIAALAKASNDVPRTGWEWLIGDKSIATFGEKLPGVASNLATFVTNLGTFTEDQVITADCAGRAIAALGQAAANVPAEDGLWQKIIGEKSIAAFGDKLPGVGTNLGKFVTNLGTFTEDQVKTTECAANAIAGFAKAGQDIPNSGGLVSLFTGDNDINDFANKLPAVGSALGNFIRNIGTFGQAQIDTTNAATNAMKQLANFQNLDIDKVNDVLNGMGNNLATFGTKLKDFSNGMSGVSVEELDAAIVKLNTVIELAKSISTVSIDSLNAFGDSLKACGKGAMDGFIDAFSGEEPKERATRGIKDLISSVLTGAESKRDELVDKFKSLFGSGVDHLESPSFRSRVESAGKYFAQGFANGINNNNNLAKDAGRNLGNAAYEAAKKAIDAHSPSKKSYKLGEFFGQGFVNAVTAYGRLVYNESYGMGELAVAGINESVSSMGGFFDDVESPTIKPVVDLTDVTNGAKKIGGLFGNVGVGANLNAISVGMSRNRQNGKNDDVVDAIDKLGSSMGGKTGDTYNINGITYGADGEISDAIGVLIRAANVERRT